jgi:hypothetical protein
MVFSPADLSVPLDGAVYEGKGYAVRATRPLKEAADWLEDTRNR